MVKFYCKYGCEGRSIGIIGKITIIHRKYIWLKKALLLVSLWTLLIPALLGLTYIVGNSNTKGTTPNATPTTSPSYVRPPDNQLNDFIYKSWDTENNYRPTSFVSFENLSVENQKLGLFKTSVYKIIKIQDLELKLYQYNSGSYEKETTPETSFLSNIFPNFNEVPANQKELTNRFIERFVNSDEGWRIKFDLGNISDVCINNFDYQVFHNTNLFLAAQSSMATVSYEKSGLILQGRAKITIEDGSTIAGNHIECDFKKQLFYAKGAYVLKRNGKIMTGRDICVDAELKSTEGQYKKYEGKEPLCIAQQ